MRVLVTGGTGFIGSHTTAAIVRAGHEVRLLARVPAKAEAIFRAWNVSIGEVISGDVTHADSVIEALDGCDAVVHAAAVVALGSSRAREVLDTNFRAVENVVGTAAEQGVSRIVYVSSLSALFTPFGGPITVDAPLATGGSAYTRSKTDGEAFVRKLQDAGAPISTSYPPAVIGPDDPGLSAGNHTLRTFLRDTMVKTSSGFAVFDVRDLAAIHLRMLDRETPLGRFVIPGHYLPWSQCVDLLRDITGTRVRCLPIPGPVLRFLGSIGDRIKQVYPFDFPLTREGMEMASRWPGGEPSPALLALGLEFRDVRTTYSDAIRWLHATGHLTADQAGSIANES